MILDTLRADAVSSYGSVEGTTPTLDRLASQGTRFTRAFAPAPWTIASHVSLFSGLRVDEHGVGLAGARVAPDSLQMLAEDFREAGYATAAFTENTLVSTHFGLDQGFDHFEYKDLVEILRARVHGGEGPEDFDIVERFKKWNQERDRAKPYFVFVNLFDPHDPFTARKTNRWVPETAAPGEAGFIASRYWIPESLCDALPGKEHIEILHGLYHGDVAAADRKLDSVLDVLAESGDPGSPLVIASSDHGEHFGENGLMGHQFTVRHAALHVPLIISGRPDRAPTVIEAPVELRHTRQSVLCWALGEGCPALLDTNGTNEESERGRAEGSPPIFSLYSDSVAELPDWLIDQLDVPEDMDRSVPSARRNCDDDDHVFGTMVSMVRYPMKMIVFGDDTSTLHDLSWDPKERFDQSEKQPELAAALRRELDEFVRTNVVERTHEKTPVLSEEGARALESLGYLQ
ncbi:MAG: sulfatase [Proteobacteria bacterium]|nr:sulfatase [Pseudomonadota bacterium]